MNAEIRARIEEIHAKIPVGDYCYSYLPKESSGFKTEDEVSAYIRTLAGAEQFEARSELLETRYCPYYAPLDGGRVECTYLGRRAVLWSREDSAKARQFYFENPTEKALDDGGLIGDAVKECGVNKLQQDGSIRDFARD